MPAKKKSSSGRKAVKHIKHGGVQAAAGDRARRKQAAQQQRRNHREKVLADKRAGSSGHAPKVIGLLSLSSEVDAHSFLKKVKDVADADISPHQRQSTTGASTGMNQEGPFHVENCYSRKNKQHFTLLQAGPDLDRQLDVTKVSDILVLVSRIPPDEQPDEGGEAIIEDEPLEGSIADTNRSTFTCATDLLGLIRLCIDDVGERYLDLVTAFGVPTVVVCVLGVNQLKSAKRRSRVIQGHTRYFKGILGEAPRVLACDSDAAVDDLIRTLSVTKVRKFPWRENQPYVLADDVRWSQPAGAVPGEPECLCVSGYLRGSPLSASMLVHLSHYGDFAVKQVLTSPLGGEHNLLDERSKYDQPEDTQWCKAVDPLANEQSLLTPEELTGPAGVDGDADISDEDDAIPVEGSAGAAGSVGGDDDRVSIVASAAGGPALTEVQTQIESLMGTELDRLVAAMSPEQQAEEKKRIAEQRARVLGAAEEDREYPDEVETPHHIPARQRFQRYRGLESLRASAWDAYESLPLDYSRIFEFSSFKQAAKRAQTQLLNGVVPSGQRITLVLEGVPKDEFEASTQTPSLRPCPRYLIASGLRRHEHKWSLLHCGLQFHSRATAAPVKSKSSVLMHIGWRTIRCNPIFAEPTKIGNKFRFLRYFQPEDRFAMASFYAPIAYPPCPVLCFRQSPVGSMAELLGYGSVLTAEPRRIILKRVVLTGQPYRSHKKQCVVRFMFFSAEDVNWFKPVTLYTRYGKVGHIRTALATHGHMKVQFSDVVQQHDTICMDLYKRVYPKWTSVPLSILPSVERQFTAAQITLGAEGATMEEDDALVPAVE